MICEDPETDPAKLQGFRRLLRDHERIERHFRNTGITLSKM